MEYGILSRVHGDNGYEFSIGDNYAKIAKRGAKYETLASVETQVNLDSKNRLEVVCTSLEGQQAVHLELWVNGQKAVEMTDKDSPLPTGTVGLTVGTYRAKRAGVAEFDNFVVRT